LSLKISKIIITTSGGRPWIGAVEGRTVAFDLEGQTVAVDLPAFERVVTVIVKILREL
jgi:hypothetical protein